MEDKSIYYEANGKRYKISESEVAEFEKDFPSAQVYLSANGKNYLIGVNEKEEFMKDFADYGVSYTDMGGKQTSTPATPVAENVEEQTPSTKPTFSFSFPDNPNFIGGKKPETAAKEEDEGPSFMESVLKATGSAVVRTGKRGLNLLQVLSSGYQYNDPETGAAKITDDIDTQLKDENNAFRGASILARETADKLSREADPTGGEKGFWDLLAEGEYGKALQKGIVTTIESAPNTLAAKNWLTMGLNAAGMAAENYVESTLENPEVEQWKRATMAIGSAAIEQAVEKLADPVFKYIGGKKAAKKLTNKAAREFTEEAVKEAKRTIAQRIVSVLENTAKDSLGEGTEEIITNFGNDALGEALDAIDGNKDFGVRAQWAKFKEQNPDATIEDFGWAKAEEYADAFIGGFLSGGYMSGPVQTIVGAKQYINDQAVKADIENTQAKGASLGVEGMYDTTHKVQDASQQVMDAFTNDNGESPLSLDYINSLSSEEAYALATREGLTKEQRMALGGYAHAKAEYEGLTNKLNSNLEGNINANKAIIEHVTTDDGKVVVGLYNGAPVYVKGGVEKNGKVTAANGENGPVIVIDTVTGKKVSVNSGEISNANSMNADEYSNMIESQLRENDAATREKWRNTMSDGAKQRDIQQYANSKIIINAGNGMTQVEVQKIMPNGQVLIKGKKGDLGGQSEILMSASEFYDAIARDENGQPVFVEKLKVETPAPQSNEKPVITEQPTGPAPVTPVGVSEDEDFIEEVIPIVVDGKVVNAEVTAQDNTADSITYRYIDEGGNVRVGGSTIEAFKDAKQKAEELAKKPVVPENTEQPTEKPVINETPTEQPTEQPTENLGQLPPESIDWDELYERDKDGYLVELQRQYGEKAVAILNDEIENAQEELNALSKKRGKNKKERIANMEKKEELQKEIETLQGMLAKITATNEDVTEDVTTTEVATETPIDETVVENETPTEQPVVTEQPTEKPVVVEEVTETPIEDKNEVKVEPKVVEETDKTPVEEVKEVEEVTPAPVEEAVKKPETTEAPTEAPVAETKPVAPNPVANPVKAAQDREKPLVELINRPDVKHELKADTARRVGKEVADMFATREDYKAYEAVAGSLGEYLDFFDEGVEESFANRQNNNSTELHIGKAVDENTKGDNKVSEEAKKISLDAVLTKLKDSDINVVRATKQQVEEMLRIRAELYQTSNGTVYGWADGKNIYLTEAGMNPNTPIHEYTHLWARAMMQKNPKGWDSIKKLLKNTPAWNDVMNDSNYSNIHNDEDAVASEALSRISGTNNAAKLEQMAQKMIDEAKGTMRKTEARGLIQNMKDALNQFWSWVGKELFGIENFNSIDEITDRVLWDLMNNTDLGELSEGQVETQIVTDPKVIAELEASPKQIGYRNVVQNEDGTFSSPMAFWLQHTKQGAKSRVKTDSFELGKWEEAKENPEIVDETGHVTLVKPNKKTVSPVAYDPYIHNRLEPVNLQFKEAWKRSDLVYVETEVAETDLNSGYHADKAKLSVGIHSWSNGAVMLSKYDKPVRVMSWEEVADAWAKRLNGEGVEFDVVPAPMRSLLVERGVEILPPHKNSGKECDDAYDSWKNSNSNKKSVSLHNIEAAIESGEWGDEANVELNNITDNVTKGLAILKRYTPQEHRGLLRGGKLLVGAAILSRGNKTDISASKRSFETLKERADKVIPIITAWAKSTGVWREYSNRGLEEITRDYLDSGSEAQVFNLGNGKVEKIIGLDYYVDPQLALDRIVIHNALFPETNLEVVGFGTNRNGEFAIIVHQQTISALPTEQDEINAYIESLGFKLIDDTNHTFVNSELYLSDLHSDNVLSNDNEKYYIIDGDFRLNTPDAGVDGTRRVNDSIVSNNNDRLLFRSTSNPISSEKDSEYLAAVEAGDMEKANSMVLEAAKIAMPNTQVVDESGNPLVVYHGSDSDFNVFDKNKGRANMDIQGMFFSPWEDDARGYGSKVRRFFINVIKPANESDGYQALQKYKGQNGAGIKAREYLIEQGYDGVNNENQEFVVFDPSQIKSADPVTYDENGNIIPLSERFNPENPDIRYRKGGDVGTSQRVDTQNAAINNLTGAPRTRAIEHAVNKEADKLGIKVTYKTREQMPKGHKNDKGYYNTKTGEVVVCTENATSIEDAIKTILHEAVAHKGLRQLMGDKFNEFINRVYESLDAETKAKVDARAAAEYNGDTAVAMEEYMATLAESVDFNKNSVWDKIKSAFESVINAILGRNDIKIGDEQLRYILRASYNNMVNPNGMNTLRGWAQDQMMREEYKINEATETPEILSRTGIDPTEVARMTAARTYDMVVNEGWQEFQRQFQDAYQPVRIAIDAIQAETGDIPIEDYENYILIQNQSSSRSRVEIDNFARKQYTPIIKQINKIIDKLLEARGLDKKAIKDAKRRSQAYQEIIQYLIAKHGIERNKYYQETKTRTLNNYEKKPLLKEAYDDYNAKVSSINEDASLSDAERELQLRDALAEYEAIVSEINTRQIPDIRDYSGLTSLFGLDSKEYEEAEAQAQELVDEFERKLGREDDEESGEMISQSELIESLWKKINAATDKTLRHGYESGLLSRQQYNDIKGMFKFYIPLRGFDETTAEDIYSYARFEGNKFNAAVQKAEGRTSLSDDPIATIMNMAESEITQGNKNRAKQALYNYLLNRSSANNKQNSLMQVEDVWYVVSTDANGNKIYQIAAPDHEKGETYAEFEQRMLEMADNGEAEKSKKGSVDVGVRFQKQMNKNAHYVYLKVNGVEKAIYVNGDPKAADAINGKFHQKPMFGEESMRAVNRVLSSVFTNYSLEFTARNYFRDLVYSHINIGVRESDPEYRKKFRQNWRNNNLVSMLKMLNAYKNGEFDGRELTDIEAAFVEFMENGGQTGYTIVNSVENHKRDLQKAIERMQEGIEKGGIKDSTAFKYTLGAIELLNESSELITRFAAYKTSRDMGRGVNTAINDAKEVTVNFNTKGAQDGNGWMGFIARYFGASKFFFNASVQGVQNIASMAKANKLKFGGVVGGVIATGFFMPILTQLVLEALGADDDEAYWNIPEYERQNNLCIVVGGGKYVKIPLPIGFREVYAIGDMVAAIMMDKKFSRNASQVGTDIANKLATIVLPINPLESTANGLDIWYTVANTAMPSAGQFILQNMNNIDWKGAPLQKEYTYNENDPSWMKAFESNPDWMKGLSKWCNEHINLDGDYKGLDWSPEKLDNTLSNLGGGIYSLIKKSGNTISMIWNEEKRNLTNVPLAGVALGSGIDNDDRFVTDAYFDMKDFYDSNIGYIKRRAEKFGYNLDDVFLNKAGGHHPKMQDIYENRNFNFMQEWYTGNKELESVNNDIKKFKKNLGGEENMTEADFEALAEIQGILNDKRRDFVNRLLDIE